MTGGADDVARSMLEGRLGPGGADLPFAAAVVRQLTRHATEDPVAPAEVAERVVDLLLAAERGDEAAEHALAADHAMLAAFFQNVDLLYQHAHPTADSVSALILQALHHATESERDPTRQPPA
jgi:hypothetical protein